MKVAISCGDINGIGLEVLCSTLRDHSPQCLSEQEIELLLIAEPQSLLAYAAQIGVPIDWNASNATTSGHAAARSRDQAASMQLHTLNIHGHKLHLLPCRSQATLRPGQLQADAGALALEALEHAATLALAGEVDAVLTLPVNKKALHMAGADFPGQTEFFARRAGVEHPMMILCAREVRVGLATIHIPLSQVAQNISAASVERGILRLESSLRKDFGLEAPRIAVLGLNPHAGEEGDIGSEEITTISPLLESLRAKRVTNDGAKLDGPFPADGFFAHGAWRNYDGILAMYHDQGLIPLKMIAAGGGVNVTAGLPFVRTSPDHGTAFGIAGMSRADASACAEALLLAASMVRSRARAASTV